MAHRPEGRSVPFHRLQAWPLVALLIAGMLSSVWIGDDFGMSFDERKNAANGAAALRAYSGSEDYFQLDALADHGPAYFMLMSRSAKILRVIFPHWKASDGRHVTHFLTFLGTVGCLYLLSLRFMGRKAAWMTTALFATQPLLFGSGFINQKDIPFMALFLATFTAGLWAGDSLIRPGTHLPRDVVGGGGSRPGDLRTELLAQWRARSMFTRVGFAAFLLAVIWITLDLLLLDGLRLAGQTLVANAYRGLASSLVTLAFEALAPNAAGIPLDYYLERFNRIFFAYRHVGAGLTALMGLLAVGTFLPALGARWGHTRSTLRNPALWTTAVLLGATVCVRQLGIFVGGLISVYMLFRGRSRAAFPLVVLWTTASAVTFATWPYLWPDPLGRFLQSITLAANFPSHSTFFEGQWLSSGAYPWYYFPKLTALQLTEPMVLLIVAGFPAAVWRARGNPSIRLSLSLIALWIGVPAGALILLGMTVYGNIRHLLFTLPALFLLGGMAIDEGLSRLRRPTVAWILFFVALLPGIWAVVWLHPYQYIYMNSLAGGVSGAYGRYELDRQCTSLREGIEAANRMAGPQTVVKVLRQRDSVRPFARSGIQVIGGSSVPGESEFVLSCSWPTAVDVSQYGYEQVYAVQRGDAVLATLWRRAPP